jgi:two-component system, sensor histidine kinase and response regulator
VLTARVEPFSLPELAAEVASSMRGLARWTNVTLDLEIRAERAVADRELVRRLLQNLVDNAVKHAPPDSSVKVEAFVDADGLVLRVTDCGPGVPPAEVDRIFERFVTGYADAGRAGGHGLGLTFCRLAAEAHGGRIWVEPREPQGTTFCVRIPQPPP